VDQRGFEEGASVDRKGSDGIPNRRGSEEGTSMDQRDSEEGALMGRRGSGRKMSKSFLGLRAARKTHVWRERNGGHGRSINQGVLLVWIQSILIQHLGLCLLLAAVSRVKERHDGKNRRE